MMPLTDADLTGKRRSKFNAQRVTVDNIRFDSKKEAKRYGELKLLEKAGQIHDLRVQPRFSLDVGTTYAAKIGEYRGDFQYCECESACNGGRCTFSLLRVEDVKSPPTRTALYRWKVKHLKAQYGIEVKEV